MGFAYPFNLHELGNAVAIWLDINPYELFFYIFLPPLLLDAAVRWVGGCASGGGGGQILWCSVRAIDLFTSSCCTFLERTLDLCLMAQDRLLFLQEGRGSSPSETMEATQTAFLASCGMGR
jgi:hypothetical protein